APHAEVLVHLAVAVVIAAVEELLVDPAVAVVVHPGECAGLPRVRRAHVILGVERGAPLHERSAGDAERPLRAPATHPEIALAEHLLAAAARELERGVERAPDRLERVAHGADVGDAHRERAGVEQGAAVLHVEDGARGERPEAHPGGERRERDGEAGTVEQRASREAWGSQRRAPEHIAGSRARTTAMEPAISDYGA